MEALYIIWIAIIIWAVVVRINKWNQNDSSSNLKPELVKEIFNSLNNKLKSNLFDKGEFISSRDNGTLSSTLKKVNGLLIERIMLNGSLNGFRVHENLEEYESYKPTSNPIDVEKMEEEYYKWLSKEATEEDLKEIFGEPKPLTMEEKQAREQAMKKNNYFPEVDDDLPF